jgi:hypothetical protein
MYLGEKYSKGKGWGSSCPHAILQEAFGIVILQCILLHGYFLHSSVPESSTLLHFNVQYKNIGLIYLK